METIEYTLLHIIQSVYELLEWPGVVLLMAIESAAIPLPSELIMPLSGWFLIQAKGLPVSYTLLAGLYGALGNLLGSLVAYAIAARGGRPLLERYGHYLLISAHDLQRANAWFSKHGDMAVLVSRLLPVIRTFISIPAGIARMNLLRFNLYTFIGSFPWCWGLAYAGYMLGENWESVRRWMRPFDIPILAIIVILIVWFVWKRSRSRAKV